MEADYYGCWVGGMAEDPIRQPGYPCRVTLHAEGGETWYRPRGVYRGRLTTTGALQFREDTIGPRGGCYVWTLSVRLNERGELGVRVDRTQRPRSAGEPVCRYAPPGHQPLKLNT